MTNYNLSEVWFSRTHDQQSLILRWCSFCHGCIRNMQSFNLAQSIIHIVLAAFLAFLFTFCLITTLFFNNTLINILIISKITCLSLNAHHQLQDRSIHCSRLQNKCQLHYHTTESVLTFISQHIWIEMGTVLGILIIEKFRTGKRCMRMHISSQQIDDMRRLNSGSVTGWGGLCAGQWRCRLWSLLSASVGWRCTCSFASPASLRILCGASLAREAAGSLVLTKHCRVSLYRSLHLFMPRTLNTPLLLFSDLSA